MTQNKKAVYTLSIIKQMKYILWTIKIVQSSTIQKIIFNIRPTLIKLSINFYQLIKVSHSNLMQ